MACGHLAVDDRGQDLYYIQESRKDDGSFYAILPQAPEKGRDCSITVQYEGDKVLQQAKKICETLAL